MAHFTNTSADAAAIERAREQLDKATQDATWEQVMKPARDVLSRIRPRLADLGLKVVSRVRQGYQLLGSEDHARIAKQKGTLTDETTIR